MSSSTKPKVHNISHCRQRSTEPRPQVTCAENLVKFGHLQIRDTRADRQTYRYTDHTFHPYRGGGRSIQSRSTYDGKRLHETGKARHAEGVSCQVEKAGFERAPAADRVTSQYPRTVAVRRKQRTEQAANVVVVTATEHRQ